MSQHAVLFLVALLGLLSCSAPVGKHHPEWKAFFDRHHARGCITIYDARKSAFTDYNPDRCVQRFAPNHTFSLVCAVAAMESGLLPDTTARIADFSAGHPPMLASVVRNGSAELTDAVARQLGQQRLKRFIQRIGYGNGHYHFSSDDPRRPRQVAISADEQVYFLKRLRQGLLPIKPGQVHQLMGLMREPLAGEGKLFSLSSPADTSTTGWYIGWIERHDSAWYFALNYEFLPQAPGWPADAGRHIAHAVLHDLGLLP